MLSMRLFKELPATMIGLADCCGLTVPDNAVLRARRKGQVLLPGSMG